MWQVIYFLIISNIIFNIYLIKFINLNLYLFLEKRDPDIIIRADNDENLMSFEKSQYADYKENSSPIIFDFKDDSVKVSGKF